MNVATRQFALVASGIACLAGLYILHVRLDQHVVETPKVQRFMFLPQGEFLKVASLGYHAVIADLLWLQVVQVMGERNISEEAGRWIYRALDIVTTLDPKFVQAYEAGGLALCTLVVLPEESNALLKKGMKNNPQAWQLPFYLGINYYFEFGDNAKAAEYIAKAALLPGAPAPEQLTVFSARLYASSREPQAAIDVLAQMYEQTKEESLRRVLEQRLKEAIVERDLQLLEAALSRYHERHSRFPERMDELVEAGLLTFLPQDPFGGGYLYDFKTQTVRSRFVKERLQAKGKTRAR